MLRRTSEIKGYTLGARDGEIGRTRDFYFDDQSWVARYLVADTGQWLAWRQVLISPHAVLGFRDHDKIVDVSLTREQIEKSPSIDQDKPVSRQFEADFFKYYNYPFYWQGSAMWGPRPRPGGTFAAQEPRPPQEPDFSRPEEGDPHLRSARTVLGYRIHALDGEIGHVEDFILNDEDWMVEYLVVDTVNWWPGKHVLVPPAWAAEIDWARSRVHLQLPREAIRKAPEYDHSTPITREYETRLFAHYDRKPCSPGRKAA